MFDMTNLTSPLPCCDLTKLDLPTPCYAVDMRLLEANLRILKSVADAADCKILLAQKAFSMYSAYPLIARYLDGTAASGLHEARLGREEMSAGEVHTYTAKPSAADRGSVEIPYKEVHTYIANQSVADVGTVVIPYKEVHTFSAAYREDEIDEILRLSDHVIFNSHSQWERFRDRAIASGKKMGLRINPECSTQDGGIYDPCAVSSRLGIMRANFRRDALEGISGLHFHTLCEQNSDALEVTLEAVERGFGDVLHEMEWLNMGGGHHITRADYDREKLIRLIRTIKERYNVEVYLEPGEAVALNAGFLVTSVLDVTHNTMDIAITDTSAACHMPDVLEMPYRPRIIGGGEAGKKPYTYRLGGPTCLAGDIIGDWSFDAPLQVGGKLVFCDMAIYSMVKNNTFNGMNLPAIALLDENGAKVIKSFGYEDFKDRL